MDVYYVCYLDSTEKYPLSIGNSSDQAKASAIVLIQGINDMFLKLLGNTPKLSWEDLVDKGFECIPVRLIKRHKQVE